ncbi:PREDICTED: uncharacterized protein LOC106118907 [Papilio xuthus]|uniref:Uncharacterized protein LOC106118907 n=2 Tax=Papilio xuthus TaxID=66420 RepID=A0AAJ6ZBR5_PAPXU|nr:PREDICTED: uncharacterized protein LOC106118907 [Papilio xuthus]
MSEVFHKKKSKNVSSPSSINQKKVSKLISNIKMPLKKSVTTMCIEAGLFLAAVVIATHLTVNVWEYFVLRSELSEINSSLHILKDTISHISSEYTKVNKELHELNSITNMMSYSSELGEKNLPTLRNEKIGPV